MHIVHYKGNLYALSPGKASGIVIWNMSTVHEEKADDTFRASGRCYLKEIEEGEALIYEVQFLVRFHDPEYGMLTLPVMDGAPIHRPWNIEDNEVGVSVDDTGAARWTTYDRGASSKVIPLDEVLEFTIRYAECAMGVKSLSKLNWETKRVSREEFVDAFLKCRWKDL